VNELKPGFQVWLEADGKRIFGRQEAEILEGIKKLGSFMATARSIGVSYAHTWNTIDHVSSVLGEHLVEARKGGEYGGGAKLTEAGLKILEDYYGLERQVGEFLSGSSASNARDIFESKKKTELPEFTVIGSDCVGVKLLVDMMLKKEQFSSEVVGVGSSGGLAAVMLGETDVAGVHLLDEDRYNIQILILSLSCLPFQLSFVPRILRKEGPSIDCSIVLLLLLILLFLINKHYLVEIVYRQYFHSLFL